MPRRVRSSGRSLGRVPARRPRHLARRVRRRPIARHYHRPVRRDERPAVPPRPAHAAGRADLGRVVAGRRPGRRGIPGWGRPGLGRRRRQAGLALAAQPEDQFPQQRPDPELRGVLPRWPACRRGGRGGHPLRLARDLRGDERPPGAGEVDQPEITEAALSSDGRIVVAATSPDGSGIDKQLRGIEVETGRTRWTSPDVAGKAGWLDLRWMQFRPDSSMLELAQGTGDVIRLNALTGHEQRRSRFDWRPVDRREPAPPGVLVQLFGYAAFGDDARTLASFDARVISVWDVETGTLLPQHPVSLQRWLSSGRLARRQGAGDVGLAQPGPASEDGSDFMTSRRASWCWCSIRPRRRRRAGVLARRHPALHRLPSGYGHRLGCTAWARGDEGAGMRMRLESG